MSKRHGKSKKNRHVRGRPDHIKAPVLCSMCFSRLYSRETKHWIDGLLYCNDCGQRLLREFQRHGDTVLELGDL